MPTDFSSIGGVADAPQAPDFSSIGGIADQNSAASAPQQDSSLWGKVKSYFSDANQKAQQLNADAQKMSPQEFATAHPEMTIAPSSAQQSAEDIKQGNYAKAIHRTITDAGTALAPMALPAVIAAPVATAGALAGGFASQYLGKSAGSAMGLSPDQANVAGDVTGLAGGLAAGTLASKAADALPSATRAGRTFQELKGAIGDHTVGMTDDLANSLSNIKELIDTGASTPQVVNKFITRIADTNEGPLTYSEARNFYSNATKLSASEKMASNPAMKRAIGMFTNSLGDAIGNTADQAGKLSDLQGAMGEYAKAMRMREMGENAAELAKKVGVGALFGAGGAAAYKGYKDITGQ